MYDAIKIFLAKVILQVLRTLQMSFGGKKMSLSLRHFFTTDFITTLPRAFFLYLHRSIAGQPFPAYGQPELFR